MVIINSENEAFSYGRNTKHELGRKTGTDSSKILPVDLAMGHLIKTISCGAYHSCAVTFDDKLLAWGENLPYQKPLLDTNVEYSYCSRWTIVRLFFFFFLIFFFIFLFLFIFYFYKKQVYKKFNSNTLYETKDNSSLVEYTIKEPFTCPPSGYLFSVWSPSEHKFFSKNFHSITFTFLVCIYIRNKLYPKFKLPRVLQHVVIKLLSKFYI